MGEPSVRDVFSNREAALVEAEKHFRKCKDDERLVKIKHFRDKYTAHIGEPAKIPLPLYKELFAFARETVSCIEKIAAATAATGTIADPVTSKADAALFWKPWASS